MASGPAADPVAAAAAVAAPAVPMVTLKVTYQGTTQRGKIQLHQAQPENLEKILRAFLKIPVETEILIERYSDSAAAYVLLDRANASVYKQLYRAAKAKSKLKLRVTHKNTEEKKTAPQPVTVEDEPENASPSDSTAETKAEAESTEEEATDKEQRPSTTQAAEALASVTYMRADGTEVTLPLRNSTTSTTQSPPQLVLNACPPALELPSTDAISALVNENRQKSSENLIRTSAVLEKAVAVVAKRQAQMEAEKQAKAKTETPKPAEKPKPAPSPSCNTPAHPGTGATFAICCNSCERTIPGPHYHCSTCDDGDFDLCQSCVDQNISCYSTSHWLIKRSVVNGQFIHSTTELICPKRPSKTSEDKQPAPKTEPTVAAVPKIVPEAAAPRTQPTIFSVKPRVPMFASSVRTCNSCIRELADKEFLHCDDCEDFDLCQQCFAQGKHGHHPKHRFTAAVKDAVVPDHLKVKMLPGRNQLHHAICDGCDKYITGVRHKCLDCPDWDYCSPCNEHASFVHPEHRFVPIYEPLGDVKVYSPPRPVHKGVCCDGPLCAEAESECSNSPRYIRGIRYKCAICPDIDFCANCEASPANEHNKTHPLVKFKTPVRQVTINTAGEHGDGSPMRLMGDRTKSQETLVKKEPVSAPSINTVQTVVDVKPSEPVAAPKEKPASVISPKAKDEESFSAVFVRDSVADGTILPSNYVFSQTWVLRNEGTVAWPAGCSVKFVGGDYMGRVDSAHPAGIPELVAANESTVCPGPLAPGREFGFTVALRTPARAGKIVSYWRLATPEGISFGHRLWCDVNVRLAKPVEPKVEAKVEVRAEEPKAEKAPAEEPLKGSTLAFPKLEKESPVSSIHEAYPTSASSSQKQSADAEDFEDCAEESEWDASEDGFMTDEEYDILDASDEEYLEQQEKRPLRK